MRPLDDAPGPDELLPDLLADTRARTDRAEVTDALDAIDGALTNNIRPLTGAAAMSAPKHVLRRLIGTWRERRRARCERRRVMEAYWEDRGEFVDPDMGLTHGLEY
jgi:hypothetical protein